MKFLKFITSVIIFSVLIGCAVPKHDEPVSHNPTITYRSAPTIEQKQEIESQGKNLSKITTLEQQPTPKISTPASFVMPNLYGCEATIEFVSGPLKGKSRQFSILDKSYFEDKGDKFAVGKGTGVFYQDTPYLILHSSYVNGNLLKPMEAEFIRKYLENWGEKEESYINGQINNLNGSQVNWYCADKLILKTSIYNIVRLSHEASNQLWLEPTQINLILEEKKGVQSEWIGETLKSDDPSIYLGFCGWGSSTIENGRYTYLRYLINFTIHEL
jgi:hypothetical protein